MCERVCVCVSVCVDASYEWSVVAEMANVCHGTFGYTQQHILHMPPISFGGDSPYLVEGMSGSLRRSSPTPL